MIKIGGTLMRKQTVWFIALLMAAFPLFGQEKETDRLQNCSTVLTEILNMPEDVPQDLLNKAECVVVFPGVKKAALGIGGSYGRGAIVCRSGKNFTGAWGVPAMFALEAGSIGFQIGGEETDFLLLVMNPRGADSVLGSKVKLGADASAAAGPKGRSASAATDIVMKAEILSYSRARGLFAGISLEGATLRSDDGANENLYGKKLNARQIVREGAAKNTPAGQELTSLLNKKAPKNLSEKH
jgi:lipid-binding SYLF domain-containing protein